MLLFKSWLKFFSWKFKSSWTSPYAVKEVCSYGLVLLLNKTKEEFMVNGQRCKPYLADVAIKKNETVPLLDPPST